MEPQKHGGKKIYFIAGLLFAVLIAVFVIREMDLGRQLGQENAKRSAQVERRQEAGTQTKSTEKGPVQVRHKIAASEKSQTEKKADSKAPPSDSGDDKTAPIRSDKEKGEERQMSPAQIEAPSSNQRTYYFWAFEYASKADGFIKHAADETGIQLVLDKSLAAGCRVGVEYEDQSDLNQKLTRLEQGLGIQITRPEASEAYAEQMEHGTSAPDTSQNIKPTEPLNQGEDKHIP